MSVLALAGAPTVARAQSASAGDSSSPTEVTRAQARAQAKASGKPVEVTAERTERDTTFALPDGRMKLRASLGPVRVRRGGGWVPIDLTLADQGGKLRPKASPVDVTFGEGGLSPLATLNAGGGSVGLRWLDPLPAPSVAGGVATYRLSADADLELSTSSLGFSTNVVLHRRPAQAPVFRLGMNASGLSVAKDGDGGLRFTDASGKVVAHMVAPTMSDAVDPATKDPRHTVPVDYDLVDSPSGREIVLRPSAAFLDDPQTVYPVRVDPSYYVETVGGGLITRVRDTWIQNNSTTDNGLNPKLRTGTLTSGSTVWRALMQFDISALNGQRIDHTDLRLYNYSSGSVCTPRPVYAYPITQGWGNAGLVWGNQPSITTDPAYAASASFADGNSSAGCPDNYEYIDVTNMARGWANGNLPNDGLTLRVNETNNLDEKRFCSMNQSSNSADAPCTVGDYNPSLDVDYTTNAAPNAPSSLSPPDGAGKTGNTPTLSGTVIDPDGGNVTAQFFVKNHGSSTWDVVNGASTTVPSGSRASYTPPAGMLQSGHSYDWAMRAFDGSAYSGFSAMNTFTTSTTPAAPGNVSAKADDGQATISWSPSGDDGGSGITGYTVTSSDGKTVSVGASATQATITGLDDGTTYTFTVHATNANGNSGESAPSNAVTPPGKPATGQLKIFKFEDFRLTDRIDAHVNVGSGNLVLHEADLRLPGTGLDLNVDRYFNSETTRGGDLGRGWSLGTGRDVRLTPQGDGSVEYRGPSGYVLNFKGDGSGGYKTPKGVDADLTKNGDGTFKLDFSHQQETFNFDAGGALTNQKNQNGGTISFSYGSGGVLDHTTDTQGRTTSFQSNADGTIAKMTDPAGRTYQYGYSGGNLTSYTDPAGKQTSFAYDSANRLTSVTDPNGVQTRIGYDGSSRRVASITRAVDATGNGPTTKYAYNAPSSFSDSWAVADVVSTDPNGHATTYGHDDDFEVRKIKDARGHITSRSYTATGNVASFANGSGAQTNLQYSTDGKDNLTNIASPVGGSTALSYDDSSHPYQPSGVIDPQGNKTTMSYDASSNLAKKSNQALGASVQIDHNNQSEAAACSNATDTGPKGTVRCVKDPNGHETYYAYDSHGNLSKITPPSAQKAQTYSYDPNTGQLSSVTDGTGAKRTYRYDALDRIVEIDYASADGSQTDQVKYAYDADGNRTQRSDATGTTNYQYDKTGHLTEEDLPTTKVITYGYDPAGNLTSLTDDGGTVNYAYNEVNLVASVTEPGGAQTTFAYDSNNNRTNVTYPNGVKVDTSFDKDANGHLTERINDARAYNSGTNATLSDSKYTYGYTDSSGTHHDSDLRDSVTEETGRKTSYSYDSLDRLTDAKAADGGGASVDTWHYNYDASSNRTSDTHNGTTTNYSVDTADQLTQAGSTNYTFDGAGNETAASDGLSIRYNLKGQVRDWTSAGALSATQMAFSGDTQDERTQSGPDAFQNNLLGVGAKTTGLPAGLATTHYVRDPQGEILAQRTPTGSQYYVHDALGSVVAITDQNANAVAKYRYDPYGNDISPTPNAVDNPWKFAGEYWDANVKAYKIGQRFYQPQFGRWTQADPLSHINDLQQINHYAYAGDDPINLTDPSGAGIFSAIASAALGCLEGAVAGPVIPGGVPIGISIAGKFIGGLTPEGRVAGCVEGAVVSQIPK